MGVFERTRIGATIDAGTRGRLTTVVAPAGYGKSVAVAHWRLTAGDRPVAWIDLDGADDDGVHLTRSLVAGLAAAHPDLAAGVDLIDVEGSSLGGDTIEQLVDDLALVPDVVVVLDNFESIRSRGLIADLATLIERAPRTAHFVVISRSDPGIGLGRLRVDGDVTEVRAGDLAMTEAEAASLLSGTAGVSLDGATLTSLVVRTSGWPAALRLAALSLRHVDDATAFVDRFSGNDRPVADYLTEEVLSTCTAHERRFLIETSILDRFNGELCDVVTEMAGGGATLRALERNGMLLLPLDGPGEWFRYHPLLRDLLRTELEVGDPPRHRELLRRAAHWHLSGDDLPTATTYLVAAQAWDELLEAARIHGRTCFERGMTTMLRSRVDAIPEQVRLGSPHAVLTRATLRVLSGQARLAEEDLIRLEEMHRLTDWEQTIVDVERSAMVAWHLPPERALHAGERALARIPALARTPEDAVDVLGITSLPSLEAITLVSMGRAAHYLGHVERSRELLVRAAERSEGTYWAWYLHSLGARAIVEALSGHLTTAGGLAARVVVIATELGMEAHPATAEAHLAVAIVRREQDALGDAAFALQRALGLIRANHRWPLLSLHAAESAWLAVASGDPIEPAPPTTTDVGDGPPLTHPAFAGRMVGALIRSHLMRGDITRAELVMAEHGTVRSSDGALAAVAIEVARRNPVQAGVLLDGLPDSVDGPREAVERLAWQAATAELEGDRRAALNHISAAVDAAEGEDLRRPLLDAGPDVLRLLRARYSASPGQFLRSLIEREPVGPTVRADVAELVEQLTDREMAVLRYLPTRLSNTEIAERLYVSVNTVKTHLKHVYRKLGADNRSSAIERAEALGLL